ncbi:MAG: hypothetical protein LBG07_07265, partial [Treponema sp.]|nr:hypothetical protein [Treponema sp.]
MVRKLVMCGANPKINRVLGPALGETVKRPDFSPQFKAAAFPEFRFWKSLCAFALMFMLAGAAGAQNLDISAGDLRIEQRVDGGFHLFIRKKPDISSVLLVESTKDPRMREDNYAYRAG